MKDRILAVVHEKLTVAFEEKFLPTSEFEAVWDSFFEETFEEFSTVFEGYLEKKKVNDISLRTVTLERFLSQQQYGYSQRNEYRFYKNPHGFRLQRSDEEIDEILKLGYTKKYDENVANGDYNENFQKFFHHYIQNHFDHNTSKLRSLFFISVFKSQGYYQSIEGLKDENVLNALKTLVLEVRKIHSANQSRQILDLSDDNLTDFNFKNVSCFVVNVGTRSGYKGYSGWMNHEYAVTNNSQKYNFTSSTKNEEKIEGDFAHLFLLEDKYLVKIFISVKSCEVTKYSISRDMEKITIKNGVEVFIAKHHGNETIIFDSRSEASDFLDQILAIKEGKFRR